VVATDTTLRKRAEERLRHSQSELQAIYDHAPVMMCVLNGAREIQYANRAFESFVGGPASPAADLRVGGVLGCITSADDPGGCGVGPACASCSLWRALTDTFETGASHTGVEYHGTIGSGNALREVTLLASTSAIRSTDATSLLLLCLVDITESKRAEAALAESRAELQALSRRLVSVQEESRRELARELHDRVGQNLTALNLNFALMQGALPRDAVDLVRQRLDDSLLLIAESMTHVRDVMAELRPPLLEEYGLATALRWYLTQMEGRTGLGLPLEAVDGGPRPPAAIETVFFRVAQEAITNAAHHARAREVRVALRPLGAGLRLTISDDGVGAEPAAIWASPGMGVTLMRERAESVGARLALTSMPGEGTTVELSWAPSPGDAVTASQERG
jgi:signal transduction histidine kinase